MDSVTLGQINKNILLLRKEIERIALIVEESHLELNEDLDSEIGESRKKDRCELISHEDMKEEFVVWDKLSDESLENFEKEL